jgi:hypothetical protein
MAPDRELERTISDRQEAAMAIEGASTADKREHFGRWRSLTKTCDDGGRHTVLVVFTGVLSAGGLVTKRVERQARR